MKMNDDWMYCTLLNKINNIINYSEESLETEGFLTK